MLFDSAVFVGFFAAFLLLYFLVRDSLSNRNILIVLASFVFYGYWDWRFLLLLILTASFDFFVALKIHRAPPARGKRWLVSSMALNLAVLGFFKYCNFFVESLRDLVATLGLTINTTTLEILLPVGISFYTFQSMSYVIDVYRKVIPPSRDLIEFLAYISFFPQLVAGPIERASHLLPQFQTLRTITPDLVRDGIALMLFGMFKKIVIADNLAPFVELAYDHPNLGAALMISGTVAFAFQIYCDFSGYSDIARGTAKLLGFDVMRNFNLPYFASNLADFWRRWHISLSTWFRDYVYFPLGGNRRGLARTYFNLFIVMLLAGLWHGARLNFVLWGCWHALGLIGFHLWRRFKPAQWMIPQIIAWPITAAWVLFGWMLFRAGSVDAIYNYAAALGQFNSPEWLHLYVRNLALLCGPLVLFQLWQHRSEVEVPLPRGVVPRAAFEAVLLMGILIFAQREEVRPFIYFQF